MLNVKLDDFEDAPRELAYGIIREGDIVRVDCGEAGAVVMMDEAEYDVHRQAIDLVLNIASDEDLKKVLKKYENLDKYGSVAAKVIPFKKDE